MKSISLKHKDPSFLHSLYYGWWWSDDARSHGISSHGIDKVFSDCCIFSTRRVKRSKTQQSAHLSCTCCWWFIACVIRLACVNVHHRATWITMTAITNQQTGNNVILLWKSSSDMYGSGAFAEIAPQICLLCVGCYNICLFLRCAAYIILKFTCFLRLCLLLPYIMVREMLSLRVLVSNLHAKQVTSRFEFCTSFVRVLLYPVLTNLGFVTRICVSELDGPLLFHLMVCHAFGTRP